MTRKLKPKPRVAGSKQQPPRWRRDRSISLYIWIIIPVVILLTAGLVGYWGYDTYVASWHSTVARMDDTTIDMNQYVKMFRFYASNPDVTIDPATFPYQVLQSIETDYIVRRGAPEVGVEVSPQEIQEQIEGYLVAASGGDANSTLPKAEIDRLYAQLLDGIRLTDDEYRSLVETDLLVERLREHFKENNVPTEAEQVHLHVILVEDQGKADEAVVRLSAGEDFGALSAEVSSQQDLRDARGDAGWVPRGIYTELDDRAFSLEVGNVSEPFQGTQGYYIVKVSEKADSRPVEELHREYLANAEYDKWFQQQQAAVIIENYLDEDMISWAIDRI